MGVDPSSVSRQVAALEAALDVRLFDRTTRRLGLTEAGRRYLARVIPILDALGEAADAARDALSEPAGLLRVTSSVAFGERWLMPRLPAFRAKHPQIDLSLHLTDSVVDIAEEGIDVALRLGPRVEGSLIAVKLFDTDYRVVAAPDYIARHDRPDTPADLQEHAGIMFPFPGFRSRWRFRERDSKEVAEAAPRAALTVSNALAIRRAVLDGLGVALLAGWTIDDDLASGRLIDLFPEFEVSAADFDTAAWLVYPSRDYVPARMRVFIDHLRRTRRQIQGA